VVGGGWPEARHAALGRNRHRARRPAGRTDRLGERIGWAVSCGMQNAPMVPGRADGEANDRYRRVCGNPGTGPVVRSVAMSGRFPLASNPLRLVTQHRRGWPVRDSLPWRFSDAATRNASPATLCRASENPARIRTSSLLYQYQSSQRVSRRQKVTSLKVRNLW
jgi:hypothetical protein